MNRYWWIAGLVIAAGLVLLAPLASPDPDGLERVAEDQGFIERGQDAPYSMLPDYTIPGIENEAVSTILAGIVGIAVVVLLVWGLARLVGGRSAAPR